MKKKDAISPTRLYPEMRTGRYCHTRPGGLGLGFICWAAKTPNRLKLISQWAQSLPITRDSHLMISTESQGIPGAHTHSGTQKCEG